MGGPDTVIGAAVTFAAAAAIWHSLAGSVSGRAGSVALALALVAFLVYNHKHPVLDHTPRQRAGDRQRNLSRSGTIFRAIGIVRQADGEHTHRDRRRRRHRDRELRSRPTSPRTTSAISR